MEVKGAPPRSMIVVATRRKVFFDDDYKPLQQPNSKGKTRTINSKKLSLMMQTDPTQSSFVDFVDKCLEWKPDKRMTPDDAFRHPWIKQGIKELKQKMDQTGPVSPNSSGTIVNSHDAAILPTLES
jgi:dual specificity tyrosine-phosphorylation-regulated kinase 2/3/4